MKKFFYLAVLVLGASVAMTSCKQNDNPTPENDYAKAVLGTWRLEKSECFYNDDPVSLEPTPLVTFYRFAADGELLITAVDETTGFEPVHSENKYELVDDTIVVKSKATGETVVHTIISISEKEMTLEQCCEDALPSGVVINRALAYFVRVEE